MPLQCGMTTWFHGSVTVPIVVHGSTTGMPGLIDHATKTAEVRIRQLVKAFVNEHLRCPTGCNPPRSSPGDLIIAPARVETGSSGPKVVVEYRFPVSCAPQGGGVPEEEMEDGGAPGVPAEWRFEDPIPEEDDEVGTPPVPATDPGLPGVAIPANAERICRSHPAGSCHQREDYTSKFKMALTVTSYLGAPGRVISTILKELVDLGILRVTFEVRQEWRATWRHVCPPRLPQSVIDEYVRDKTAAAERHCRGEAGVQTCYHMHRHFYASLTTVAAEARGVIEEAVTSIWDTLEQALSLNPDADGADPVPNFSALDNAWASLRASFDDIYVLHQWEEIAGGPTLGARPLLRRYYVQPVNAAIGVGAHYYLERAFIGLERDLDIFEIGDLKDHLRDYVVTKVKNRVKAAIKERLKNLLNPGH